MSKTTSLGSKIRSHDRQTGSLSDSPDDIRYIENYYARRDMSLRSAFGKVNNINTGIERGLTEHIKEGIRLKREAFRGRETKKISITERKEIWHGIEKLIFRDALGRFARRN
jgi:hypothetical protein